MDEDELERHLSFALGNSDVEVSIKQSDESEPSREPDKFIHYETQHSEESAGLSQGVEHEDPMTIPLTESSLVVAVWEDENASEMMSRGSFEKKYR